MKNNKVYMGVIISLIAVIILLVSLLFTSDSGKYCKPTIKQEIDFPKRE